MKKLLALLVLVAGLFIYSCEEPPPPVPDCEQYGYGWVTAKNNTGYSGYVDVTYYSNGENYEKFLYNGGSYKYEMDEGKVYIWFSFDGSDWAYDTYYLGACEDLTYTWYLNKKKSTGSGLYAVKEINGVAVDTIRTLQVLER